MTLAEILSEIDRLSVVERLKLMEALTQSLQSDLRGRARPPKGRVLDRVRGILRPADNYIPTDQELKDDYANYLLFHEILSCANACLIRAVSLQEAFDMITSVTHFDLLIINIGMPGNENCRSIKRIKALWPELTVIAFGGCKCKGKNKNCFPWGCDALISHHIDDHEMMAVVDEFFTQIT